MCATSYIYDTHYFESRSPPSPSQMNRMKRGLEEDLDVPTPVSYEEDDGVESPSKRGRSTPPPTLIGPVHVNALGKLAPSMLAPKFSSLPGIRRLLPKPSPIEVQLYGQHMNSDLETLLSSLVESVIFIFENEDSRVPQYLMQMPELQNVTVIVNDKPPTVAPGFVSVMDPSGELAKECRVVDPVGGGRRAVSCVVYAKNRQVQATAMLGGRPDSVERSIRNWM